MPKNDTRPGSRTKRSEIKVWYEENLQRWTPLLATVVGGALLYLLLQVGSLKQVLGLVGALAFVVVCVFYGIRGRSDVMPETADRRVRIALGALVVLWVGATAYPIVRARLPGKALLSTDLRERGPSATLRYRGRGPMLLVAHGEFRSRTPARIIAPFSVRIQKEGKPAYGVRGEFEETYAVQSGRRGRGRGVSTNTVDFVRFPSVRAQGAGEYKFTLASIDPSLRPRLHLEVYRAPYPLWALFAIDLLLLALAVPIDAVFSKKGKETYVTLAVAVSIVFAYWFQLRVAPDNLPGTVLSGAIIGGGIGGAIGGTLGWLGRKLFASRLRGLAA